ncbi:hypothetical protein CYLTODRAFT_419525 [Cylindrobasidium torrendii FP15055 ss-10]|uniref:Uncharacterized protein n=1 Tax=Cylindrobasidium torrendii FP15055 ss-10 TaxID=1314674 RepID=A0A0D7BM91_9AGAR|nr:hypothetical protein CYLTODRAFT_419525 [Cylindrobasidium torrendii FP15055 ss-10]
MLRRRGNSETRSFGSVRSPSSVDVSTAQMYPHTTTYRSLQQVVRVFSPSLKASGDAGKQKLEPVFGESDTVSGSVTLDPSCAAYGRLTITLEGALYCHPSATNQLQPESRKHVFYTTSHAVSVSTASSIDLSSARSAFRGVKNTIRRRPSASSLDSITLSTTSSLTQEKARVYTFAFQLPKSVRQGEELPPTYPMSKDKSSSSPASRNGSFSVEYKILVSWDPSAACEYPSLLEAPILYQPDHDFNSASVSTTASDSWLEMPLRTDRPVPFRCAITLPTKVTFARSSSIPYFVVFTTLPRSATLSKEIASDATISVSLLRQVTVMESSVPLPTPPHTPNTPDDESSARKGIMRLMSRPPSRTQSRRSSEDSEARKQKPLPRIPPHTVYSEMYTMRTSICIGFPKRPRRKASSNVKHPTIEEHITLPDGLHKAKFLLDKDMLPSIDWAGISVKYYLDASVLVGQDEVRARVPIRIY